MSFNIMIILQIVRLAIVFYYAIRINNFKIKLFLGTWICSDLIRILSFITKNKLLTVASVIMFWVLMFLSVYFLISLFIKKKITRINVILYFLMLFFYAFRLFQFSQLVLIFSLIFGVVNLFLLTIFFKKKVLNNELFPFIIIYVFHVIFSLL